MESAVMNSPKISRKPVTPFGNFRAPHALATVVAVLAGAVSAAGRIDPDLYADKGWLPMSLGNDLITLAVAVPVLIASLMASARGSLRGRLLLLGSLYFMFYNYAFYVFGLTVTKLYVPLIAVYALSGFALVIGLRRLDVESAGRWFHARITPRVIAAYLLFAGAMVGRLWISQWVNFLMKGTVPTVNGDARAYQVIAAVDLSSMVPMLLVTGYLLWARRPWGYVLGVMITLQSLLYMVVMGAVCVAGWLIAPGSILFSAWFINCIVSFVLLTLSLCALLLTMKRPAQDSEPGERIIAPVQRWREM